MGPVNSQRRYGKPCDCCDSAEVRRSAYSELLDFIKNDDVLDWNGIITYDVGHVVKITHGKTTKYFISAHCPNIGYSPLKKYPEIVAMIGEEPWKEI